MQKDHQKLIIEALTLFSPLTTTQLGVAIGGHTNTMSSGYSKRALEALVATGKVIKSTNGKKTRIYTLAPEPKKTEEQLNCEPPTLPPVKGATLRYADDIQAKLDDLYQTMVAYAKSLAKNSQNQKDYEAMEELIKENTALRQENERLYKQPRRNILNDFIL